MSEDDLSRKRFSMLAAEREVERARADLAEVEAGAWEPEVRVAEADVATARAALRRVETELDRLIVRAPVSGRVLQVNARAGEMATPGGAAPVVLGDTGVLHVRIDIDEADAPRVVGGARATASLKGRAEVKIPLRFVKIEPYVIPKRSLTGMSDERVDTRVLQVVYAIAEAPALPVYVGQQVDAFIDAGPIAPAGGVQ